jgi:uracil-DNA glycosylase family 4
MPEFNDEVSAFLNEVKRYLMQQEDLFGNIVYSDAKGLSPHRGKEKRPAGDEALERLKAIGEPWVGAKTLEDLDGMICTCVKCPLGYTRNKFVFGVGDPHADVVLIGEAPGAEEDAQGEPFVGRAGQLLNKILEAVGMRREEVYICNIIKCRPPENREPLPSEMETCVPYLWKQLDLIKPKIILCLGRVAAQVLLKTNDGLNKLRGKVFDYQGSKVLITYHPAALLRNPGWKRPTWEDMQFFKKILDEARNADPGSEMKRS